MRRHGIGLALAGLFLLHGTLLAQESAGDAMPRFESLLADPDMTALGARVMWLDGSDSQLDDDVQGEAVLGENLPIVALARGARPLSLGIGASVMARFALATNDNPMIAHDWSFQVNVANRRGPWTLVGAVWHESYHLGDEYVDLFGQDAKGGAREGITLWAFYQRDAWRLGASASTAFRISNTTGHGRFNAGADYAPVRKGRGILPRAGIFLDLDEQGDWDPAVSLRLGAALPIAQGTDVVISLAGYTGPSTLGYFRPSTRLKYLGVEFRFDL